MSDYQHVSTELKTGMAGTGLVALASTKMKASVIAVVLALHGVVGLGLAGMQMVQLPQPKITPPIEISIIEPAIEPEVSSEAPAPKAENAPAPKAVPKPAAKPEPKPEPKPIPKVEPKPIIKPEPKPIVKPEPKPVLEPKPTPDVVRSAELAAQREFQLQQENERKQREEQARQAQERAEKAEADRRQREAENARQKAESDSKNRGNAQGSTQGSSEGKSSNTQGNTNTPQSLSQGQIGAIWQNKGDIEQRLKNLMVDEGVSGNITISVKFEIDASGKARTTINSIKGGQINRAKVRQILNRARFTPYTHGGQKVASFGNMNIILNG
ncbi:MAG: hypothetical protein Q4G13_06940 [Moraxella sp.]|nr:hypothetical protein [Moraxella sp.]